MACVCGYCDKEAVGRARLGWAGQPSYATTCGEYPCPGVDAPLSEEEAQMRYEGEEVMGWETDKNYEVPEGFEAVYGPSGIPVQGYAKLTKEGLVFNLMDGVPKLPLKDTGKIWHPDWDTPTLYAIDADGACWMDFAHGFPLTKIPHERLLAHIKDEQTKESLRAIIGLERETPKE